MVIYYYISNQERGKQPKLKTTTETETMTNETRRRIEQALNETKQKLNKELAYREDLQHDDMVSFYMNHIASLESRLSK